MMELGTPGVQSSTVAIVPSEDDMTKARNIILQGLDAIVGLSKLNLEVQSLTLLVDGFKTDLESLRRHNTSLDEALQYARNERDEAKAKLRQAESEIASLTRERDDLNVGKSNLTITLQGLNQDLAEVRKERDTYGLDALTAKEELSEVKGRLDKLREQVSALFPAVEPAKPEPMTTEAKPVEEIPDMHLGGALSAPVPSGTTEAPKADPAPIEPWWKREEREQAERVAKTDPWKDNF